MTQPTIEHVLEEIRRLPVRCEIQKLDNSPSDEFLRGWALGIAMSSKTAKDECSKLSQLVSALTAQEVDGNRLPLDEVPEGYEFYSLKAYTDTVGQNYYSCTLRNLKTGGFVSPLAELFNTPAEAMRAAIKAAKDGAK